MSSTFMSPRWTRSSLYICDRCSLRLHSARTRRRWLHSSPRRLDYQHGTKNVVDVLEQRGYINQITGTKDELQKLLTTKRVGAYVGIDPTASSMHVGHLIPFMALFWLYLYGHRTITLVGGGTASVGDPSGRVKSRPHLATETRHANIAGIEAQLKRLWHNVGALGRKHRQGLQGDEHREGQMLNNEEWLRRTSIMDVLGTVGAGLRLGAMLGRDTVKNRMTNDHHDGMSFAEFSYPVLQAWDWWHMYQNFDVQMQIGGSDQYGNILSGVDGIKYASKQLSGENDTLAVPVGFTVPLLTTSSGEKFGKSAGNAIWLDKDLTSVFDLYGFFVGMDDAEVEKHLNLFTFLPASLIQETVQQHKIAPEKRIAQRLLAREFVELVHGSEEAEAAQQKHMSRSGGSLPVLKADIEMEKSNVLGLPFSFLLHAAGLAETRSKATKLIDSGGAYLVGGPESRPAKIEGNGVVGEEHLVRDDSGSEFLVLRAGKWKTRTIGIV